MSDAPRVSVLMSVYNGAMYLRDAIDSILSQTYTNFEFLIIDDASTDNSLEIISSYNDKRIILVQNTNNLSLPRSLNKLLDMARGEYIVRMDADDVSLPERISKQVEFMDTHTEIGLSGTARKVYIDGEYKLYNTEESLHINERLLQGNCIAHPTVIMRKSMLDKYSLRYDPKFKSAQDYELWIRMSYLFPIGNMPDPLLIYRHHEGQMRVNKAIEQERNTLLIENAVLSKRLFRKDKNGQTLSLLKRIIGNYIKIIRYSLKT